MPERGTDLVFMLASLFLLSRSVPVLSGVQANQRALGENCIANNEQNYSFRTFFVTRIGRTPDVGLPWSHY